ncbi:MAG: lysophospholipid acyltransferase family protein [Polyangia bacterium]|jgi:1-acyl-sn-glycerol-3-phosphate acyltransferase|nr:lysophospholipid acyltransferase family protein [Polyangia bacterium]
MKSMKMADALSLGGRLARAGVRTLGVFGGSTAVALAYTPVAMATGGDLALGATWTRRWAKALVMGFGLRLEVQGELPGFGALIVSNHRSYVDIAALGSLFDACFIAKAQIRHWPVLGFAFGISPTLFVDRGNPESTRAVREAVRDRLARGLSIINFAEGTTKDGPGLLPFKRGLFVEAQALGIPVVPVTLTYTGMDRRVEWVGDDTFFDHFLRLAGHSGLTAHVHVLPALRASDHADPELLVRAVRRAMLLDLAGREDIPAEAYPELA